MSTIADPVISPDGFVRKKWTVRDCRKMTETGLLEPGKYELIEGEIISKMGQGRLHIAVITQILKVLTAIFGIESIQNQAQIGIGELDEFNDPEPDIAVLVGVVKDYVDREPDPAKDVLLVVEAAVSSLPGDSTTKAQIYARNGLAEYWVVSVHRRQLLVFREPTPDGYRSHQALSEADSISPLAKPEAIVSVKDLFP